MTTQKDYRDLVGGLLMAGIGAFAAWYSSQHYDFGDLRSMGPGFFPTVLGILLAVLGVLVALPALLRHGERMTFSLRTLICVIGALILFATLLKTAGVVLTTVATVLVASLADRSMRWRTRVIAAVAIAALTWLVFIVGLSMVLPTWPWSN